MPKIVVYLIVGFLLLAVLPLPYGYYTLLRLVAFGVFAWAAYITFERGEEVLPWVFIVLALIYNPIIKVYLSKEIWTAINLLSAGLVILSQRKFVESE